jgi:acetolactate decarboxylase
MWNWLIILCLLAGYTQASENQSTVVQISTVQALLKGVYDSETTFGQLKTFGDFGFGTVNGLDGEMLGFDGQFYQVKGDGSVHLIPDSQKTPYATVHFFRADKIVTLEKLMQNYTDFQNELSQHLPSRNRPYALKITGTFDYLKTRSVHKQKKPYPPAIEVTASQPTFEFKQITGTAVGYWFPDYMEKLNVPGYHLHFISEDKQHGGHVLNCRLSKITIAIDFIDSVHLFIPQDKDFLNADLSTYSREELDKVEKDKN